MNVQFAVALPPKFALPFGAKAGLQWPSDSKQGNNNILEIQILT